MNLEASMGVVLPEILIYIHALIGFIALLTGTIAIIAKKGTKLHKVTGRIFFWNMIGCAVMALIISSLPGHKSQFLFLIGLFSSYFILTGYSATKFNRPNYSFLKNIILSITMLCICIYMIFYALLYGNIVLLIFGSLGIIFSIIDLNFYKNPAIAKEKWLGIHLGNMLGGYIASVSAFAVVNQLLPYPYVWFVPGLIGSIYIYYWLRKIRR